MKLYGDFLSVNFQQMYRELLNVNFRQTFRCTQYTLIFQLHSQMLELSTHMRGIYIFSLFQPIFLLLWCWKKKKLNPAILGFTGSFGFSFIILYGEACALTWASIAEGHISVTAGMDRKKRATDLKTDGSNRKIYIDKQLYLKFMLQSKWQKENKLLLPLSIYKPEPRRKAYKIQPLQTI